MYTKTLIAFVILLCLLAVYLVFNCNCEKFQNNTKQTTEASNEGPPEPDEPFDEPEPPKPPGLSSTTPVATTTVAPTTAATTTVAPTEATPAATTTAAPTEATTTAAPTEAANETSMGVMPVSLDSKYKVNMFNTKKVEVPELKNIEFIDLSKEDAKVDIISIDTSNLTFSVLIKPTLKDNIDEKSQENSKQVIASSENWYIELKSRAVKFVYNGVSVESKININFNKVYLVSAVVANNYTAIMVNGNITEKEYNVPSLKTTKIKLGLSARNTNPFHGLIANMDLVEGALKPSEVCDRHNYCSSETPTCSFKPAGKNRIDCVKLCDLNDNCSSIECQNACLDCKNPLNCEWLSLEDGDFSGTSQADTPDAPEIRAIAHGSGQIILDWQAPESNGSPIKNYAIIVNESFNKNSGLTFRQLADTSCTSCEYIINGLKNRVYYDISVAAVNDIGVGDFSNVESVAPVGPVRNTDISPLLIEDDAEIEDSARKLISESLDSQICNSVLGLRKDGHYLNKKRVRFADQVREELVPKLAK